MGRKNIKILLDNRKNIGVRVSQYRDGEFATGEKFFNYDPIAIVFPQMPDFFNKLTWLFNQVVVKYPFARSLGVGLDDHGKCQSLYIEFFFEPQLDKLWRRESVIEPNLFGQCLIKGNRLSKRPGMRIGNTQ